MNYYISDMHLGCTNKFEGRILEHDKIIAENWNKIVTNSDTVYILGDIARLGSNKDNEYACQIISTLKGKKVLITGNHDVKGLKDIRVKQLFTEVCDYKEISENFQGKAYTVVMSHYPILCWNGQHKGWIHLYGHLHNSDEERIFQKCLNDFNEYFKDKTLKGRTDCPQAVAFNVGCAVVGYKPVTLAELLNRAFS